MNLYKLLFLNTFFCVACVGCVTQPPSPVPVGGFVLNGKLAVRTATDQFTARFIWRQDGEQFDVDIWGPLGQGRVHLRGDGKNLAVLDGASEVVRQGPSQTVMQTELGWSVPLEVFPAWVVGMPMETVHAQNLHYDAQGRLSGFVQLGWAVKFAQYRAVPAATGERWLPRQVEVARGPTRVRLAIASWQI